MTRRHRRNQPSLRSLKKTLRESMDELRSPYGVRSFGVFGSYVQGTAKRGSDLDILVEFDRVPTLLEFVRLERQLSERLGVKVDLVMRDALKPNIGRRILEEVVAL